jgi:PadR family transcriptional regulator, regulatory protein PadR
MSIFTRGNPLAKPIPRGILRVLDDEGEMYGVPLRRALQIRQVRVLSVGALYAAVDRLESAGYVTSRMADPTPARGNRARRYVSITEAGRRFLAGQGAG